MKNAELIFSITSNHISYLRAAMLILRLSINNVVLNNYAWSCMKLILLLVSIDVLVFLLTVIPFAQECSLKLREHSRTWIR
jgi:hypothetical protein